MFLKLALKIAILLLEIFLAFYSIILTDNLLIKFLFFTFSAVIVAFLVFKLSHKLLPSDKDYISEDRNYEKE